MYEEFYRDGDALYDEVLSGNWTWETLRRISSDVWSDINNDGVANRDDRLGYCINGYNNLDGLFYGSGARVTERDNDVLPAYYEILMKNKYARDDVSAEMIDIIRENCSTDIAYLYGDPFNGLGYIFRNTIQAKSDNFASEYAKRETAALTSMEKFIEQFLSVE